jgi:formylglycine-generating enzyme required for sulfatase activity
MILAPFYIDETEVRAGEFAEAMSVPVVKGREGDPAASVSFQDAKTYAARREKRLPTADEWEAAAGPAAYPWGSEWSAAIVEPGARRPRPVGTVPEDRSTGAGCLDMGGNVQEWTIDPRSPSGAALKGGSYLNGDEASRYTFLVAHRDPGDTTSGYVPPDAGLRCARDVPLPDLTDLEKER